MLDVNDRTLHWYRVRSATGYQSKTILSDALTVALLACAASVIAVSPWLGMMDFKDYEDIFKNDIALAKELSGKLPDLKGGDLDAEAILGNERHLETLDGAALRALRQLLDQKDASKQWGNLKQILTPEGDYLWLCEHHARSFNP